MKPMMVFHATEPSFLPDAPKKEFPADFTLVAVIDCDNLSMAYQLTNNIEAPWTENAGVTVIGTGPYRSTSVGDVILLDDGTAKLCANAGWDDIQVTGELPTP